MSDNPEMRCVEYSQPGRSNDIRLFFEGSPESNAKNPMGNKIGEKVFKRQCGPPTPEWLRIFVLNFKLTDYGCPDWLSFPYIAESLDKTIRILVDKEESDSLPYDVIIPAMLGYSCSFGEPVILDFGRKIQIEQLISQTSLSQKCQVRVQTPPPELINALQGSL